jgi:D-alanyl-D-alanine carboxypeptidase/D-alanyl-D-alanine-endopeptidase (penicillin-binding protein 4)
VTWNREPHAPILLLGSLLAVILALCGPAPAGAGVGLAHLQVDLSHQLKLAGPHDGAYVYDITDKEALFSERANAMRPPASVEKLYTSATALDLLGAEARMTTAVYGLGHLAPGGVWEGSLYLRGGGDPTFGTGAFIKSHYGGVGASLSTLVSQLVHTDGIKRVTGTVNGDESYFDSLRGEPSSDYDLDPFLEGTLSALSFNRGETGHERGPRAPAAYAARRLRAALREDGVALPKGGGAASTPAGVTLLAHVSSPTVSQLLGLMLPPSDNFFAETLLKDLGARFGGSGTTAAGAGVVSRTISSLLGIQPVVVDGSGLSPADHTSPYQVADMLVELEPTPVGAVLRDSLAVAGETGTLAERMRHTTAAGRCMGKTGTLTGASNLVGYCQTVGGDLLAFAIFNDDISTYSAHVFQDHMVITTASY